MTAPPLSVGAVHAIYILFREPMTLLGVPGGPGGTPQISGVEAEASESPTEFYATTLNSY